MGRVGAALLSKLASFQVYGANTNVGKTIASTVLCKGLSDKGLNTLYLKPVSTGPVESVDTRHIKRFAEGVTAETLFQFSRPVSPHIAARLEGNVPQDDVIIKKTLDCLLKYSEYDAAIVETAGGVLSPAPSGSAQADLYRPLRLPTILVGDFHLGGIATTTSAYESLHMRGYDVLLHIIFMDSEYMNSEYLEDYFWKKKIPTLVLQRPPQQDEDASKDNDAMWSYYSDISSLDTVHKHLHGLVDSHTERLENLETMSDRAVKSIWYPFTQHKNLKSKDILVIDSAYEDNFDVLTSSNDQSVPQLSPAFDASASWWTQGLGHGDPELALTAAHAAGRYGHVMFAGAVHQPALELAEKLLEGHENPKLAKVFYSDNGSTGMEVAIKMALRATGSRYGWGYNQYELDILGLKNSYHGDTIGVMDASEPSTYNEKVDWYEPKGYWFDYPKVQLSQGTWKITVTSELEKSVPTPPQFESLSDLFNASRFDANSPLYKAYESQITSELISLRDEGRKFGALILEPVLLGAGGMILIDPLYQHVLINAIRNNPSLISTSATADSSSWSGLPIIFDEVFAGLGRLGPFNCNNLVHAHPDIVVNAKLLTGGLIPLCTTTASQAIFDDFLHTEKEWALLHGHSYTAHAIGCSVGVHSLNLLDQMPKLPLGGSVWDADAISRISNLPNVDGVIALGTVLAITLKDAAGGGYTSSAAEGVKQKLLADADGGNKIHSRVLGNVIYFMTGLKTKPEVIRDVEAQLFKALEA